MSKKRQRRLTIVGVCTVLTVWIAALALLFSQPGANSGKDILPTLASPLEGVAALPNTGGVSPTLLPTGVPVDLPADSRPSTSPVSFSPNQNQTQPQDTPNSANLKIPSDPVPNSMVIHFKPEMTAQERLDYIASLGGQIVQEIKPLNTVIINLPAKANANAQAQTQSVAPGVLDNEPDYYAGALLSPNDALAAGQWGLNVVKAPQAWDLLPLPMPTIKIAVIDSGICASHADLQGRIASDGWDFVQNDSTPQDEFGHGCAVSGIIAANSNNGLGIAGVAPNTAIMPLRVLDGSGLGRYSNVAAAIVYAVDNGAQAINLSLGGPNASTVLQDAVNYAEAHGVTVIAAAGNGGVEQAYYPAAYPPVVAVGSIGQNLQRSAFSNYGAQVDLYAPGSNIMTTSLDGSFQTYSGTSVAAPYVTGVWALRKAMGKALVLDGGIVSAVYDNEIPVATEQPPSELCVLNNFNDAETAYFNLVQQNATQPGSVSDAQLQSAKTAYLSVAGQCANVLYDGPITIDGGALSPIGGEVAPQFQLFGHKWGEDSPFNPSRPPAAPVPPTTPVTFSFMPTGVSLAAKEAENGGGPNAFITAINQLPNNTTQCDLQGRIRQAFAAWSQVANITFVEIPQEGREATGAPIPFGSGDAGQVGDIRIGAQIIDGMKGELGHAYYPPPEDTDPASANIVRSGDIFLDRAEMWGCAPGETQLNGVTVRVIDIGLVALHEIGHALGMRHEAADQQLALMNPTYKAELLTPNDQFNLSDGIQPDDKSGVQGIYGALGVSAPTATFPVDNTDVNDNTPPFTWTDTTANGSDYFDVQIYTNDNNQPGGLIFDGTSDGGQPDAAIPNAKAFTLQTTLESQSYLWRVRSFVTSDWGPWSSYQAFSVTVGIASLRRPVEGETLSNGSVNFEWSPIVGGNSFHLQIATRPEFSDPLIFDQDGIAGTRFVINTPLADGTYYWRVSGTGSSLLSRVGSFIVDSTSPVVDLSAGNGAVTPADDSAQPNQGVTLSWPTLPGIDEYQVQVDTSENFAGLLYLDRVFLDRVFLDRVFLDRVFLDRVFLDRVFLDRVFLDRVFLDRVFLDRVFLDRVFLDRVFLDRVFLDRVFLDRVFLDRVFLDRVFLDRYSLDKVFLDRVFLDRLLFDKVNAAPGASSASVTLADASGTQRISEGTHYWRVRAHLADGTFGPWSVGRKFEVHTQATKVVINEIKLTDPSWVEFHNTGLNAADMTNWNFFAYGPDGATQLLYTFPSGFTLQPNGYVVLYEGQGANTDRTLFTNGSQIDWPLTAQTTLSDPNLLNQMGAVVSPGGEGANTSSLSQPNQPTIVMGPNGPLLLQGGSLKPLNLPSAPANKVEQNSSTSAQGGAITAPNLQPAATSTPEAVVSAQTTATPAADVSAQSGDTFIVNTTDMTDDGQCDLDNCTLIEAINAANGESSSTIELANSETYTLTAVNNTVDGFTGLPAIDSDITINGHNSTIERSSDGGTPDFRILLVNGGGTLSLNDLTIQSGGAPASNTVGGAIFNKGILSTNTVLFTNNQALYGGAITNINGASATLFQTIFSGNAALTLSGGAVYNAGTLTISNSTFSGNSSAASGGAIEIDGSGTADIVNSSFDNNEATNGGAISVRNGTFLTLNGITFNDNSAANGGAINNQGTLSAVNNTFAENTASANGGALNNAGTGEADFDFSTFNSNSVTGGGQGGGLNNGGSIHIKNSIVANNTPRDCNGFSIAGEGVGFNTDGTCLDYTQVTSGQLNLQLLTNNGGLTQTVALGTGSVAINAVTDCTDQFNVAITADQRGTLRPQDTACDVGAYEAVLSDPSQSGPTFTVNTTAATNDGVCGTADCSLIEAFHAANAQAGANTIELEPSQIYTLTTINNGTTGLPVISTDITLNMNGSTIERDSGAVDEFRIFTISASGNLTLNGAGGTISGGVIASGGSAGAIYNLGTAVINNTTLANNFANFSGAIYNESAATLTINDSLLLNNEATQQGGAIISAGMLTINHSVISANITGGNGGGLSNSGTTSISDSLIAGNTAGQSGGGVYNTGTFTIWTSTVKTNTAEGVLGGGGILNTNTLLVNTSTIANNINGGIRDDDGGGSAIVLSTIAYNTLSAGITSSSTGIAVTDSIVANNAAGNCNGGLFVQGANFATDASCTGFTQKTQAELKLQPLANNGGPTQTIALGAGSAAIDTVIDCLGAIGDQRGIERPQNVACDAGAYEFVQDDTAQLGPTFTVNTTDASDDTVCGTQNCTLIEAINAANADGVDSVIDLGSTETYTLTQVNNAVDGSNGLPDITSPLTITGHDSTITRSGTNHFRFFHVDGAGSLTLNELTLTNGNADSSYGGAIFTNGALTIINVTLSSNAANQGGALFIAAGANAEINDSHLTTNASASLGGGFYVQSGGLATVITSIIDQNNGGSYGGGLYADGGLSISHSAITDNTAGGGAGLRACCSGTIDISDTTIANNTAASYAGGIMTIGVHLNLSNSTVSGNVVTAPAAPPFNGVGGGILNRLGGTVEIVNSTIANNSAASGGGIWDESGITLSFVTITGNTGGGVDTSSVINVKNSIITAQASGNDCSGDINDDGVNFSTSGQCTGFLNAPPPQINLQSLGNNGGVTKTIALGIGSIAINAATDCTTFGSGGTTVTTDQRGVARPQGAVCDAGAYEATPSDTAQTGPTFTVNTINMNDDGVCGTANCSLIEAIKAANDQAGANTIDLGSAETYTLSAINNNANGLPVISTEITINGDNSTINRSNDTGTPDFRIFAVSATGNLSLNDALLGNGSVTGAQGGIIDNRGILVINNVILEDGFASSSGAIYNGPSASATLHNSTMRDNRATTDGAALGNDGTANIDGSSFFNNAAGFGGAIINNGTMTVNTSTFTGNQATTDQGGAIANFATLTVDQSTFTNNTATTNGGAIDSSAFGTDSTTFTITNSTLNNNSAAGVGGAVGNFADTTATANLTVRNSTISGNSSGYGGGIANFVGAGAETLTLEFSTVVGNQASQGSNLYNGTGKTFNAKNSIVAQPVDSTNCVGVFTTDGPNFADDASCNSFLQRTAPQLNLGALTNNGGPTQTVALGAGSVASDSTDCNTFGSGGTALATDQRGVTRPQGPACDAGAYETTNAVPTPTPGPTVTPTPSGGDTLQSGSNLIVNNSTDIDDGVCGVNNCSLREAINRTNALPSEYFITFVPAIEATPIVLSGTELTVGQKVTITPLVRVSIDANHLSRIFNVNTGDLTLNNISMYNGKADSGGAVVNSNILTLSGVSIYSTEATTSGGAIANGGVLHISGSSFYGNTAGSQGGAILAHGVITITSSYFYNNTTTSTLIANGGAIFNDGDLTITDTAFLLNRTQDASDGHGGAISSSGALTVNSTTFNSNSATDGGGIYTSGLGVSKLTNATFANNMALTNGGGLFIGADTSLSFVTVADSTGGGIYADEINYNIRNSIVTRQTSGTNCDGTGITASGANFADDASCGGGFTNTSIPLIDALAYNNGPVDTYALTQTSPARDVTTCTDVNAAPVTTDARGVGRPQGVACDAGAYEFGGDLHVTTTQIIDDANDGKCSLTEAITAANTGSASGSVNGECIPAGTAPETITLAPTQTYKLTQVNNTNQGPNGLPVITATINFFMNGSTITRASDAPDFRIFHLASGGNLFFANGGFISGGHLSGSDKGAGILNRGSLVYGGPTFENNIAAGDGGAIYNDVGASVYMFNSVIRNNRAGRGGAFYNAGLLTTNNNFMRFEGNQATQGGAVYNASGTIDLSYATFLNNHADAEGGSVYNAAGSFTSVNPTISGGQATQGSAIFQNSGTVDINFATIADNTTTGIGSGALVVSDGTMTFNNSIVANNPGGNCAMTISGSNNLQYPGSTCGVGFTSANPLLSSLTNSIWIYYSLLDGSPAIDAAPLTGCPTSDGHGSVRPIGTACDIGSTEGVGVTLVGNLTVTTTSMAVNASDGLCSLTEAIIDANADTPVPGAVQGECVPNGTPGALDTITLGSGLTYTLTETYNLVNGANGLPVISSPIIINGNGSTITRNSEAQFRVFYVSGTGSLTLNKLSLTNGDADHQEGGAILADGGLTMNFVSIANNTAQSGGGLALYGPTTINNSSITGNITDLNDGAGILVDGTLTISNTTIANNQAAQYSGGIVTSARVGATTTVTIYNSTIANNVANTSQAVIDPDGSGIRTFGSGTVLVYNSIIANNTAHMYPDTIQTANCFGNVQAGSSFGSNLQWPDVTCTDEIMTADPLLGPLTGNPAYLPLGVGSAAINAGENELCADAPVNGVDQRGVARPANACDIGAIEATELPALLEGTTGGGAALVSPAGTQDFVRFGDTTIGPIEDTEWRGDNVAIPSSTTFNIGRDPLGSDTNHVTDWLSQGPSEGGQNFAKAVINEVFTGTNDLVELYNPIIDTVDLSGWELTLYDSNDQVITLPNSDATTYTYRFPNGTLLRPGQFLVVAETNPGNGIYAITLGANTINWDDENATGAVSLTNGVTGMDFVRFGGSQINPLTVDAPTGTAFTGTVPAPLPGESIGRNADSTDTDTAGDWYSQGASVGTINPTLNPPDNDTFTNAILINPLPFRDTGNTLSATAANDPATSCGFSVGHTVWYKFTAANSNPVHFQTDGSDFDTVLAVFSLNTTTNALQQVSGLCSRKDDATGSRLTLNPTANTIYYVMIGGHLNASGSYVFSANAPANDDIDNAINIGTLADLPFRTYQLNSGGTPISNTNVTAASQLVSDPTTTCATTVGRSVWYTYTAADATRLRLRTTGTQFDTVIAIYTGSLGANGKIDRNSLQEVACNNDDTSDTTSDMGFTPVPDTTYYIEVAGNSDAGGSLLFEVNVFPAPANDLVENAYVVTPDTDPLRLGAFKVTTPDGTVNAPFAEDTTGATATNDATASCGLNLGGSVWFIYTDDLNSTTPDTVVFQTFSSDYDTAMTIYTGTPDNLIEAACSDDVGVNQGSRLTLGGAGADVELVEGQTYTIRISGYFGETGDLSFNAFTPQAAPPANDDPNTPYTINFDPGTGNYTIEGVTDPLNITPFVQDTTGTIPGLEDVVAPPKLTCGEDVGHTVWYRYVAPERQRVVFDAGGSDFDTVIAAFVEQTDGDLSTLVEVGCNDDNGSSPQSKLTLNTGEGVILYVMFGGYKQDRGNLKLGIQQIVPAVTDFTLVNAGLSGDIRQLTDPDTLNLPSLPPIAVRANTEPSEVGSVKFELRDFGTNALVLSSTDNMFPYSLTGNEMDGSYTPWTPTPGVYKLTATPYTEADGEGKVGTPLTIKLTITGANLPPVIAADAPSIPVNEGLKALNSGTFSDPDGDTIILSASVGTVTADLSDPQHPVWNWSFVTSDGPADSQNVTITADDGHGNTTPVTFALAVKNVAPTATFTPMFVSQNVRRLTFGTPVDVNADLPGIVYRYDCTFDNDGNNSNDDFDVSNVTATTYDCTFPGPGSYTVRGRIADKDGGFSDYTADITISTENIAPVVNAGDDQSITLPVNSVALLGIVSDDGLPAGSTLTYTWTAINNPPAPVIFSAPDALSTNATFTVAGTYTLQLSAFDSALTGTDSLTVVVNPAANVPPTADAGDDQLVTDTAPYGSQNVTLDGSGSGDSDGSIVGYAWTEGATLLANTATPIISLADGVHTITLTVTDNKGAMDTDDVTIEVRLPDNQVPVVNAGDDQNISLPINSVSLTGSATDDGLPLPANLTYTWSGPTGVTFGTANAASTTATFSGAGSYTLQLTVSDGQLSGSDTVIINVNTAAVIAPTANAGADQLVPDTAPFGTENVMLDGSGSTDDGTIVSYVWTEGTTVIANGVKPTVALADGIHTITLTVTDNDGASDTDEVIVEVRLPANQAPVVNAGSDQSITLPINSVALLGIVTDDGLPLPPALTYTWTPVAGVTFSAPNALSTNATFSAAGTYILTLTASDGQLPGSDTVQVVVSPQNNGSNEVTDQVEKSSDDVNEDGSTYDATNPLLWFGTGQDVNKSYMGLRFNNLEIPKGVTITEAHIEVYTATAQWINMRILIGADAVDNSATFTRNTRPSTRPFSTARLDYRSNTPWMAGTWNDIGDVKAVVQEIVNRTAWQSGNSLSILIKGLGSQWGRKFVTSYDGDPAHAPRLVISYAGGPPPPNQSPVIAMDIPSAVATAVEGQAATTITGTFGDPDNNPVTLTPSLGTLQIVGNTWKWNYTPPDGPVNTTVTISAQDSKGALASPPVTFNLNVSNVAPTAVFAAQPASTYVNNAVALTFSSPVDVAADLASLTYMVDCGNGSAIQTAAPFSCTYASVGTFTALGTVADKDGGLTTYQAVITVSSTPTTPTTITPQVNASSDDVNQTGNTLDVNKPQIWVGTEGNAAQSYTGLRFNNLSIPVGSTITESHLEFYTTGNTWINVDVLIAADAADNSVTFSNATRPSTRTFTTTRVTHHSDVQWLANSWNTLTGNLAGVVQEVVSRAGWQSGNSLSIILKGIGSQWARKFATSYEGNPAFAPRLVISYTPPATTSDDPPVPLSQTIPNPPSAAFAAGLVTGDAPLAVQFTNTSTGDIAGYAWNFGDGATSTDLNPAHTYTVAGSYTVTLVVTGTDATTSTAQVVITVTTPVVVSTDTPPTPTETPTDVPVATTPPPSDTPPPDVAAETTPPADQPASP